VMRRSADRVVASSRRIYGHCIDTAGEARQP
jgi:hypothetical protein